MHTEKRPGVPELRKKKDHLEGYLADGTSDEGRSETGSRITRPERT